MLERFRKWRAARRAAKFDRAYSAGYAWAMAILAGTGDEKLTPEEVYDRCSDPFDGPNPFDRGALAAVYAHELQAVEGETNGN